MRIPSIIFVTTLFLFLLHSPDISAQIDQNLLPCSSGKLYYIMFPDTVQTRIQGNVWDASQYYPKYLLHIYSPVITGKEIHIEITRADDQVPHTLTISSTDVHEIDITGLMAPVTTEINIPLPTSVRIESDYPVIVHAVMATLHGEAAFTPIPVELWGREYVTASWQGDVAADITHNERGDSTSIHLQRREAPAEILLVAAYDNTRVQIFPSAPLKDCSNCTESIVLNAGEVYMVQSRVDTTWRFGEQEDIAGSLIRSNKPVGVLSGNSRVGLRSTIDDSINLSFSGVTLNSIKDLAVEWIPPVPSLGTNFTAIPVWSKERRDDYYNQLDMPIVEQMRITAIGGPLQGKIWRSDGETTMFLEEENRHTIRVDSFLLYAVQTTSPAFTFSSPAGMYSWQRITGGDSWGTDSWGTSMVEQVPREQWGNFALVRPFSLIGHDQYLYVVTDTASSRNVMLMKNSGSPDPFPFNRGKISGTDLVAGSIEIGKDTLYTLQGIDGARFSGYVYGTREGEEVIYVSVGSWQLRGYGETIGLSYAYPLPPSRCDVTQPDSFTLSQEGCCCQWDVRIRANGQTPSGLSVVRLDPDSSSNVKMELLSPSDPEALTTQRVSEAVVRISIIDPAKEARAVILYRDRTTEGEILSYDIPYTPPQIAPSQDKVNFGFVPSGTRSEERPSLFINSSSSPVVVKQLQLLYGDRGFRIVRTDPSFNWSSGTDSVMIGPDDSLIVWTDFAGTAPQKEYQDSLVMPIGCLRPAVLLQGSTVDGSLSVDSPGNSDLSSMQVRINPAGQFVGIDLWLPEPAETRMEVYTLSGHLVTTLLDNPLSSGGHHVEWDGSEQGSGLYYLYIRSGTKSNALPIVLIR